MNIVDPNQSQPKTNSFSATDSIDIRHYFDLLWQWLWLMALAGVIAGVAAYFFSQKMTPVYETTTNLLVIDSSTNNPTDYNAVMASERLTSTYSNLLTNESILQDVIKYLNLTMSPQSMAGMVTVAPVRDTQVISISVRGVNPEEIAKIANALVEIFIKRIQGMQSERFSTSKQNLSDQLNGIDIILQETKAKSDSATDPAEKDRLEAQLVQYRQIYANLLTNYEQARLAEAKSTANVVQVNAAQPPTQAVSPKIMINVLIAIIVAMALVIGTIFLIDALDDTIKNPEQVTQLLGLPVLGGIFRYTNGALPITQDNPRSPVSEAFRMLRTNLQYANIDEQLHTLIVTSPTAGDGKTSISCNLSIILAQSGKKVILLDADLRRPEVHHRLDIPNTLGTTSLLLQQKIDLEGVLKETKTEGLSAIPAGILPPNPAELLGSQKMRQLLERLKGASDMLIIDTPPVLPVADTAVLATMIDGVLLVLRPGTTKTAAAKEAVDQLRRVNARIIGVVLNNIDIKASRYKHYYQKNYE